VNDARRPQETTVPDTAAEPEPGATALVSAPSNDPSAAVRTVPLASGRCLEISEQGREESIHVRSADGQILLALRLTDAGPVLSVSGVSLEIAAQRHLALASNTLSIQTAGDATVDIGGSLRERTRGSALREAGGASIERAREVQVEAFPGGVVVKANDDVSITGERVRLNSDDPPMPLTWEEHRARQARKLAAANEPTFSELELPDLPKP
jgi:hypothetical protein